MTRRGIMGSLLHVFRDTMRAMKTKPNASICRKDSALQQGTQTLYDSALKQGTQTL